MEAISRVRKQRLGDKRASDTRRDRKTESEGGIKKEEREEQKRDEGWDKGREGGNKDCERERRKIDRPRQSEIQMEGDEKYTETDKQT